MNLKRIAGAAAIAVGVGISTLMSGIGPVNAAPMDPPPSPTQPAPGGVHEPAAPTEGPGGPHSGGGGPHSGGGGMTGKPATP
jgi:hypothetical protein